MFRIPAFQSLVEVPRYIGYEGRELSLEDRGGFRPDLDALARLVDERTVAIVINTPQNPTGIVFTDAEIGEFARIADSVGAELLADEHYRFIPHNGVQLIPSVYGRAPNVIAAGSMIKRFGCVGLRVGWLLGPGPFIDACRNLKDYTTHTQCSMVELLALRTFQARGALARRYTEWARANVAAFGTLVARHSHVLTWIPPQAGLVAFPRLLTADITASDFCVALFERTGVFVLPGEPFGRPHHFSRRVWTLYGGLRSSDGALRSVLIGAVQRLTCLQGVPKTKGEVMNDTVYLTNLNQVSELADDERTQLAEVAGRFVFRSNDYYQSLINWSDPDDPIRRIIMPNLAELNDWGTLDASDEAAHMVLPGLEHKYASTALLLVTDVCAAYCRFCFRKRLFMNDNDEVRSDIGQGIEYIKAHREISNVLLTGGDPLILSSRRLADILDRISAIPHVRIIRIGTKMPAFNPFRIIGNTDRLDALAAASKRKCLYVMAHFNHPRELTAPALQAIAALRSAGAVVVNQTPIIRGVNDNAAVLSQLFEELSFNGVPPYYVFQCRPTLGNLAYALPLEEAYDVFLNARSNQSGLAKWARFVMSHASGKIEVVAKTAECVYFRYHEAADIDNANRLLICRSNPAALWFDDYAEAGGRVTNGAR